LKRNSKVPTKNNRPHRIEKAAIARSQAAAKTTASVSSSACCATTSVNVPDARIANPKLIRQDPMRDNHMEAHKCRESGAVYW
jgi:hypothetical protein